MRVWLRARLDHQPEGDGVAVPSRRIDLSHLPQPYRMPDWEAGGCSSRPCRRSADESKSRYMTASKTVANARPIAGSSCWRWQLIMVPPVRRADAAGWSFVYRPMAGLSRQRSAHATRRAIYRVRVALLPGRLAETLGC